MPQTAFAVVGFTGLLLTLAAFALFELVPAADGGGVVVASVTQTLGNILRRRRGRPRKFSTPSRAITLTLPESTLEALGAINPDPSKAVAQLVERRAAKSGRPPAELAVFGRRAVITIRPTVSLEQRTGVSLVPLPDGRALISFDHANTIAELELTLYDALEAENLSAEDRKVFEGIANILKEARLSDDVELQRRNIIVLESADRARTKPKPLRRKSA